MKSCRGSVLNVNKKSCNYKRCIILINEESWIHSKFNGYTVVTFSSFSKRFKIRSHLNSQNHGWRIKEFYTQDSTVYVRFFHQKFRFTVLEYTRSY